VNASTQYQIDAADMGVVLALGRAGTLAAAGARLAVDASTVFRSVQRIEKGLGQSLFERSRAGYRPTDLALAFMQHAERIEAELEAARAASRSAQASVTGSVRISTTDTLLYGLVLPALRTLAARHPLLQLELLATNELANLTTRDADIAVRATRRPPNHLVGRQLGPIRAAIFGPAAARKRSAGPPAPESLPWIAPDDAMPEHASVRWRRRHHPKLVPRIKVNSIQAVMEGIAAGLGVGILPLFMARGRRDLQQLSPPLDECETQLWLLTHPESRHLRRVAAVFGHLAETLGLD